MRFLILGAQSINKIEHFSILDLKLAMIIRASLIYHLQGRKI